MLHSRANDLLKSAKARKFLIYGFGQAVNLVSPLLVIPYIVGVVGESGLGKIGVGMSVAYILIVLVDYSSYIKGVKDVALQRKNPAGLRRIIATVYLSKLFLVGGISVLFGLSCAFIPYLNADPSLFLLSFFIIYGQFINPTWFLQGLEDFKTISAINIISKVIYVAGVFLFVTKPTDYIYVNFLLGFGAILPGSFILIRLFYKYRLRSGDFKVHRAVALIKDDFSFCVSQLLFAFRQYSPILIIDLFAGNFVAGQYKIIEQIIMLFRTYLQMVFKFTYSIISFEIHTNITAGIKTWKQLNVFNIIFLIFLLFGIFIYSDFVFSFFNVDVRYLAIYDAMLEIAIFIPVIIGITLAQEQLVFSFNKNKEYIKITIFITFFSTLCLIAFLTLYHLNGALLSLLLTELILMLIYFVLLKPFFKGHNQDHP